VALKVRVESLPEAIVFLVREDQDYSSSRSWGSFDTLQLRALDDLSFAADEDAGAVYGFSSEPPHSDSVVAVTIPLQLALERIYFHAAEPERIVLNPRGSLHHAALPQQGIEFSVPGDFDDEIVILRDDIPEVLGALTSDAVGEQEPILYAEKALYRGSFFESFYLARIARIQNPSDARSWFYELFAFSFFGKPDDVLALYEEYPERGSAEPHAQLLSARYRLLLHQLNEARTILHTLTYHETLGALASCELARSFLIEKLYTRAIDGAVTAIAKDRTLCESYLVRGMAQRGLSYEVGDREGLGEAYSDFERVAKQGGYNAAEALYHAGTVSARLGALPQAEQLFRQSLFQRGRISPRDALIRVLCALGKGQEAGEELSILKRVAPSYTAPLEQLERAVAAAGEVAGAGKSEPQTDAGGLWSDSRDEAARAARDLIRSWGVPISGSLIDCALLDDFINRFAPDGDFPTQGAFSALHTAGDKTVTRALALHVGALLVTHEGGSFGTDREGGLALITKRDQLSIPLENFVRERILLGASGDNFSSLESLALELTQDVADRRRYRGGDWWTPADEAAVARYREESTWTRDVLRRSGLSLRDNLSDFEQLDRWIDEAFEPGGGVSEKAQKTLGDDINRFVSGLGLLVGHIISSSLPTTWFSHDRAEGISIVSGDLGRLFPIARLQRRIFIASAADFSTKLSSLAWSVAVAATTEKIRSGKISDKAAVRTALIEQLPSIETFPEHELAGVVESLLISSSLPPGQS
jgi:hypothetical protein